MQFRQWLESDLTPHYHQGWLTKKWSDNEKRVEQELFRRRFGPSHIVDNFYPVIKGIAANDQPAVDAALNKLFLDKVFAKNELGLRVGELEHVEWFESIADMVERYTGWQLHFNPH